MYSDEKAKEVCRLIAQGHVVPAISRMEGMPDKSTIYGWLIDKPEFLELYDVAKEKQKEVYEDMIIDIAMSCPADADAVARAKLIINTIQWTMGKIKPKKYGDSTTIKGDKDSPLTVNIAAALDHAIAQRAAGLTIEHQPAESIELVSEAVGYETVKAEADE